MYTLTHYCTYTRMFSIFVLRITVLYERMFYNINSVLLYNQYFILHRKYTKNVDQKPPKNLWRPRTFQQPLEGFQEVFKCCPFQKDNI